MGTLLGNALATMGTSLVLGAEGGRAYVVLVAAPHHKVGRELRMVRRQARLALGLLAAWMAYTIALVVGVLTHP